MNILHLVHAYQDVGGILSMVRNLVRGDSANTHFLVVNRDFEQRRPSKAVMLRTRWAIDEGESQVRLLLGLFDVPELWRLIRKHKIDVVHAQTRGAYPILMALGGRVPRVASVHLYARRTGLYRAAFRNEKIRWVFATPNMLRHYGMEKLPPHAAFVPACYDSAGIAAALEGCRLEATRNPGVVKLVGVGYFWERKRWHVLIQAVARLSPEVRRRLSIDIYGDATSEDRSIKYKKELLRLLEETGVGDVVHLCGTTPNNLPAVAGADWLAMPSVDEPCSVALLESLGLGTPVLGTATGGTGDIVRPGLNGHLCRPDDIEDFASALARCADRTLPHGTREEIRASSLLYADFNVAAAYDKLYRQLPGSPP